MRQEKVLLVTRNFPPIVGGMERLNYYVFESLKSYFDVSVSGPQGSRQFHKAEKFTEFPPGPLYAYLALSVLRTAILARKVRPNIIFCGSGAAILAGYISAKLTGAKLVCYLHGLDIVADSFIYQKIFIPLIKKSDLLLANSHHTKMLAIKEGFDEASIKILFPGTHLPQTNKSESTVKTFKEKYQVKDAPLLLIAGRITKRKGIEEFVTHAMPVLVSEYPHLKLLVVGDEASKAIKHQFGVREKIVHKVNQLGLQKNVSFLGAVDDATLSGAFFSADMLVFPVLELEGDVEGFGMVAIEAAAHGLPSVGFRVGGVPDAISSEKSGWLLASGNYAEMSKIILENLSKGHSKEITPDGCIEFARGFEWKVFGDKLINILREMSYDDRNK